MDVTKHCSKCRNVRPINDYLRESTGLFNYRTCITCREVTNAAKRARQDGIDPQATGPAPKRYKPRKPLTEISTNVRVFDLRDPVHTWNSKVEEDKEQAAARRHRDARAKKLRACQRTVRRGDTPPPLTPSQAEPFTPPGRHPPVPAPPLRQVADEEFDPKWCTGCRRERHPDLFPSPQGIQRTCGDCRLTGRILKAGQSSQPTSSPPNSQRSQRPPDSQHSQRPPNSQHSQRPPNSQRSQRPPTPLPTDPLQVPAVSEGEWAFIQKFNQAIDAIALEEFLHCNERWFNLDVQNGACKACRKKTGEVSTVFSADNHADVGFVPAHLPALNDVEEMLIARVHTHLQVRQVKGQQYRYTGHTVHFMQDTVKVYNRLPVTPEQLDIILLKPASGTAQETERAEREFAKTFKVRKSRVMVWLTWLRANHPDYRDIEIDDAALAALPIDGSIHPRLLARIATPREEAEGAANQRGPVGASGEEDGADSDDDADQFEGVVPNLRDSETEVERLHRGLNINMTRDDVTTGLNYLSAPAFRSTPMSEFDQKCIFRMAFPTLFPFGKGDVNKPRRIPINIETWARHLLRFKDGRFGRHTRWRYVVFNTIMRQNASKQAKWACKKADELTVEELRQLLSNGEEHQLVGRIARSGRMLKGTRPFWGAKRTELEAMVRNLNCPHLFFTFSAADLQWHDLHRHMPDFGPDFLTDPLRIRRASRNLVNNPHIAAEYIKLRFEAFFRSVVKEMFNVDDHWYRFEWQQRGSGHVHGFLWLKDEPNPTTKTKQARAAIVDYWSRFVTAKNPDSTQPPRAVNPACLPFTDQYNTKLHLTQSINRFQRHTKCTHGYCLRRVKGGGRDAPLRCRFHYPKRHRDRAELSKEENPNHWKFLAARDESLLNPFNPVFTLGWLANTDMSPCTNAAAVLNYLAKYASKAEQKSESYKEIFHNVSHQVSDTSRRPLLAAATKMLNSLIGERDWPAQEVSHLLLDLPLAECSRQFRSLDLRPDPTLRWKSMME